jgi:hypothetical protein
MVLRGRVRLRLLVAPYYVLRYSQLLERGLKARGLILLKFAASAAAAAAAADKPAPQRIVALAAAQVVMRKKL